MEPRVEALRPVSQYRRPGPFWLLALALVLHGIAPAHAELAGLSLHESARFLVGQGAVPRHRIDAADFDGDGRSELVLAQDNAGLFVVSVLGAPGGAAPLRVKQAFVETHLRPLAAAGTDIDGPLLAIKGGGLVNLFRGWPLEVEQTIAVDIVVNDVRLADVDGDGRLELLVLRSTGGGGAYVRCHDLRDGSVRWTNPVAPGFTGRRLHVVDRPGPGVWIVVTGMPAYRIDGSTGALVAPDLDALGNQAATATSASAPDVLVHAWNGALRAVESAGWTQAWAVPVAEPPTVLLSLDLDGDDRQELVFQTEMAPVIQAITQSGGTHPWQVAFPWASGLGAGSLLAGTGRQVLAVRSIPVGDVPHPVATLFDAASGGVLQELPALRSGPYTVAHVPDADRWLLAQAATSLDGPFDAIASGMLRVVDGTTGTEVWRTPAFPSGHLLYRASVAAIHAADFQGQRPPLLIVVGGNAQGQRLLAGFNAEDGALEWSVPAEPFSGPAAFQHSVAHDGDGDGIIDSVFACSLGEGIEQFAIPGGQRMWHSGPLSLGACRGMTIAGTKTGDALIGAFDQALHAYDLATHALIWSLGPSPARSHPAWIDDPRGSELAVVAGWDRIDFYRFGAKESHRQLLLEPGIRTVAGIPGSGLAHLLVGDDRGIRIIDGVSGQRLAGVAELGPASHPLQVIRPEAGRALLGVGTAAGVATFDLGITDVILQAPFE